MLISVERIQSDEGLYLAGTLAATGILARGDEVSLAGRPIAFSVRVAGQGSVELDGWLHTIAELRALSGASAPCG